MATIQFRRQLKYAHPKSEALNYIKTRLNMIAGEPLICTYKESNGKWGVLEVICIYPKGTPRPLTIFKDSSYDDMFENNQLKYNIIKNNADDAEWEQI